MSCTIICMYTFLILRAMSMEFCRILGSILFREDCLIYSEARRIFLAVKHVAGSEEGVAEPEEIGEGCKSGVRCSELVEKLVESA